ncbi:MAG TPA: hypothetical protein VK539_39160 [Myxococcaceae bacterium]|nr:hypothetical protein [Myxococcaceae bacterium]
MLTKLYRFGPSQQALLKGFVVAGDEAARIAEKLCAPDSPAHALAAARGLSLRTEKRSPGALWVDTGLRWLHTAAARASVLQATEEVVSALMDQVKAAGALLLPNAVRPAQPSGWRPFLCGDIHQVDASSDVEKATYCNLLRVHLPELLALTGRAGVGPEGIEAVGSRRLCESEEHLTARLFASVSPRYLEHLRRTLLRDDGIKRLELLDVNPNVSDAGAGPVELRFVDGQIRPRTAFVHALVFQALLMRARRLVSQGRAVRNLPQRTVEQQRSLVVAYGPAAVLERADAKPRDTQGREGRPQGRGKEGRGQDTRGRESRGPEGKGKDGGDGTRSGGLARDRLLELLEDLRLEFIALEASYDELAPIVLGANLRAVGLLGLENEGALVREALGKPPLEPGAHLAVIHQLMSKAQGPDPLTSYNERRFAKEARTVREAWQVMLTPPRWQPAAKPAAQPSAGAAR